MGQRNLPTVNNLLEISANGAIGDVVTRLSATEVGWSTPGGIAGINASNAGVPVAGGPFTTIDANAGTFADEGGGVVGYTPPAVPAQAWATVSQAANQDVAATVLTNSNTLVTGALLAGVAYRIRARIFITNTGGGSNGIQCQMATPALTTYREQLYNQPPGTGGNLNSPNIGTTPILFQSANTGEGALEYFIIITPSAPGVVQFTFGQVAAGVGTATVRAGSFLEYGTA